MGESGTGKPPPRWAEQTPGQRMVTAAWRAVAAHLALDAQRVATGGAGDLDPAPDDPLPPAVRDRLR